MKKTITLITISLITASLLFGCNSKTVDNQNNTASNNQSQGNFNGRGQFQRADMSGQVVSINGSQVTIKVIKQQQFGGQNGNNENNNNAGNNNNNFNNNNGSGNNSGTNNGNGGNPGVRQRRQLEFTGETKTITIPEGTQITMMVRGNGNQSRETKELQVKDIKAEDILQIWFTDKDKGTVSKINVQEFNQNRNGGNSNNTNNNSNNNQTT